MYTFCDISGILYTATNVPDIIKIPDELDVDPITNKSFTELLILRFAIEQSP